MTKGTIQVTNKAKKEQITHVMKSNRNRMQKEEEMEKQTKINKGAVKTSNCMDVDLAFSTNTSHSWVIHSYGIHTIRTRQRQYQERRREEV